MPRRLTPLSWDRPLLAQAVAHLAAGWTGGALDLSAHLIVVPTRQAGRHLREALAVHAASRGGAVLAPRVLVPEQLLELAAPAHAAVATRAQALVAWTEVLLAAPLDAYREVFPVDPPRRQFAWALRLAEDFTRLQGELAEGGLRFADVAARAGDGFPETDRWRQLGELETRFDAALRGRGLFAADAAKIAAARAPAAPPPGVTRIALLGLADPLPLALSVLDAWSAPLDVEVLVLGPEGTARPPGGPSAAAAPALFDDWGRPNPGHWSEAPLALPDFETRTHVCLDAAAQSARVAAWAHAYAAKPGLLAVGCADAELLPVLAGELAARGVVAFVPEGRPLARHALAGLLEALRELARTDTFAAAESLARRPEILAWLAHAVGEGFDAARFLEKLDDLHERNLPPTLAEARRHVADAESVAPALATIADLAESLRDGAFPAAWQAALSAIFAGRRIDTSSAEDREFVTAAQTWRETAEAVAAAGAELSATDAGELALRLFGAARTFGDKPAGALDLDGWLELLFRDEPHLVVAGLNDGAVPESVNGHAYLPESLRERLGLKTNARRLARDAWQLAALAAVRAERGRLDLVLGQASASGDPLRPSRLLLLCDDAALPARVQFLFRGLPPPGGNLPWRRAWTLRPPWVGAPEKLRVTGFRDYLRCPFRFYLRHALKMEAVEADKTELDPRDFGTLLHAVLEQLGHRPAWRDCADAQLLTDGFLAELDRLVHERFGPALTLPLLVQVESARQRLRQVAHLQAAERAAGWVIQEVEWKFPAGRLALAGLPINGTIDRIERNEHDGRWRVLDYKTAETAKSPDDAHLAGGKRAPWFAAAKVDVAGKPQRWIDLQLPLYRWALRECFGAADAALGYFNLPKAVTETAVTLWSDYDDALHASAMACAERAAASITARHFWPPIDDVENDEFEKLIHDGAAASFDISHWPAAARGERPREGGAA